MRIVSTRLAMVSSSCCGYDMLSSVTSGYQTARPQLDLLPTYLVGRWSGSRIQDHCHNQIHHVEVDDGDVADEIRVPHENHLNKSRQARGTIPRYLANTLRSFRG